MSSYKLIIFTRFPHPGKVKTRLIPALGDDGAATLHETMTLHTLRWANQFSCGDPHGLEIRFDGGDLIQMRQWLGAKWRYVEQGEGDLGSRIERAFQENFANKSKHVVLVGTDCPQLTVFHVREAFSALKIFDMVIGPTEDGGYYLIGLNRHVPELFKSIEWGTETVFEKTMERGLKLPRPRQVIKEIKIEER